MFPKQRIHRRDGEQQQPDNEYHGRTDGPFGGKPNEKRLQDENPENPEKHNEDQQRVADFQFEHFPGVNDGEIRQHDPEKQQAGVHHIEIRSDDGQALTGQSREVLVPLEHPGKENMRYGAEQVKNAPDTKQNGIHIDTSITMMGE
ncbi:MAG TPA: hypothetical protein PLE73_07510 [Spirochaetota bacterium]|nr:hypothetical protein [Spirochaetota bacterium]HOS38429.1 hypothetical protein [Spirochaetota bacterium]HPI23027.1 hypothetical protein [Spirochaetota bacterium]